MNAILARTLGAARDLLRQREGPLTRELARSESRLGLGQLPERAVPDATTTMVCGFCSTGCGLDVHLKNGEAINLTPATDYPVNLGMACPKGWKALAPLAAQDRATHPLSRSASGEFERVSWARALGEMSERFSTIKEQHGGDALAFLSTGQIPTEEMAYLGALAKFGMGMRHGDGNTRQCMATSVVAYKESFGFDAPPYTYGDFEESDVIVLVGSNLCIAHPILWERVTHNPHSPEIVVVDPRRTETAQAATQHFAIQPKSDLPFFYAIAHELIARDWIDHGFIASHTEGFDDFALHVAAYSPEAVETKVGLSAARIRELAATIHQGRRVSLWWTMGVNQGHEAVRTAQALIALALMTGNIGRPGTGANSITGQCNAMGSRLFSNTSSLFGARSFESAADRAEVAGILGLDVDTIPDSDGLAYDQIIDAIDAGRIRGLWIVGTNTAHSWFDRSELRRVLAKLDFLVVQDLYTTTETARLADLVLPAAAWGEKEGTVINSERRVGLLKKVARAPGEALSDFQIFRAVAEAWGCSAMFDMWKTPEDVFSSLKALSRGRPCDISGIEGYEQLDDERGIQWPWPAAGAKAASERRLFEDGLFFRENGRALFVYEHSRNADELPCDEFPLVLLTGRGSSAQWHTETRTSKSGLLSQLHTSGGRVELHPMDAAREQIASGDRIELRSRRGAIELVAVVTHSVQPGQVFVAMHDAAVNELTGRSVDPYSRQPSYKYAAVRVSRLTADGNPRQSVRAA